MEAKGNPKQGRAHSETSRRCLLTIADVAERLSVGERHVRRLVAERRIPYLKWGHLVRFEDDVIDAWLDDARVQPRQDHQRRLG